MFCMENYRNAIFPKRVGSGNVFLLCLTGMIPMGRLSPTFCALRTLALDYDCRAVRAMVAVTTFYNLLSWGTEHIVKTNSKIY